MPVDNEALLDLLPDVVIVMEPDGTISYANAALTNLLGWGPHEVVGRSGFDFVHPDEQDEAVHRIAQQVEEPGGTQRHHVEVARRDGGYGKFEMLASSTADASGQLLLVLRDISEREEAQKQLHRSAEQLRALTENVPDALGRFDQTGQLLFSTRQFSELVEQDGALLELWGARAGEVLGTGEGFEIEHPLDGAHRWMVVRFVPERDLDGTVTNVLVIATDITDRKANEQRLIVEASHDPLTGLPNRRRFQELTQRVLAGPDDGERRTTEAASSTAVVFIDLDGFKAINDLRGHAAGDAVLVEVARRLGELVRPGDVVARFGGDEFVMLCHDTAPEDADAIATRIAEAVARPVEVDDGGEVQVTASVGLALGRPGGGDLDALILEADEAMYRAKRSDDAAAR